DEIHPRDDGGPPEDEDAEEDWRCLGVGLARVGRIEGPAGVRRAVEHAVDGQDGADPEDVEAGKVEAREGDVLRTEHDGEEEIPETCRDRRDEKQPDHHHAMEGEELVVHVGRDEGGARREVLEPKDQGEDAAHEKKERDGDQKHHADALVVLRGEPGPDGRLAVEVVFHGVTLSLVSRMNSRARAGSTRSREPGGSGGRTSGSGARAGVGSGSEMLRMSSRMAPTSAGSSSPWYVGITGA